MLAIRLIEEYVWFVEVHNMGQRPLPSIEQVLAKIEAAGIGKEALSMAWETFNEGDGRYRSQQQAKRQWKNRRQLVSNLRAQIEAARKGGVFDVREEHHMVDRGLLVALQNLQRAIEKLNDAAYDLFIGEHMVAEIALPFGAANLGEVYLLLREKAGISYKELAVIEYEFSSKQWYEEESREDAVARISDSIKSRLSQVRKAQRHRKR